MSNSLRVKYDYEKLMRMLNQTLERKGQHITNSTTFQKITDAIGDLFVDEVGRETDAYVRSLLQQIASAERTSERLIERLAEETNAINEMTARVEESNGVDALKIKTQLIRDSIVGYEYLINSMNDKFGKSDGGYVKNNEALIHAIKGANYVVWAGASSNSIAPDFMKNTVEVQSQPRERRIRRERRDNERHY